MQLRSSIAAALIQPLAWELPYATHVAIKKKKKNLIYHLRLLSERVGMGNYEAK